MTDGERIVTAARLWLGTRWAHQGRLRGVGVDCLGLVIGALSDARVVSSAEIASFEAELGAYERRPDGRMLPLARRWLREIPLSAMDVGDIVVMRFEHEPQHLAIVGRHDDASTLIHAHARARRVVEHRIDDVWRARIVAAFRCGPA